MLSIYSPAVACFGPQYTVGIASGVQQNLLSQISVDTQRQIFGPEGEPGVQVVVPVTYIVSGTQSKYEDPIKSQADIAAMQTWILCR